VFLNHDSNLKLHREQNLAFTPTHIVAALTISLLQQLQSRTIF